MKENGKLTEKIAKGVIIGIGTGLGLLVSAFVKTKEDDPVDLVTGETVDAEYEIQDDGVAEEVTEG